MITIDLIPASYGDTLLLSILPKEKTETFILVDCGMKYAKSILPVIMNLKNAGKKLDRFIVTHYDKDHILSAARFIKANGKSTEEKIITIDQVWLNTYRHLQPESWPVALMPEEIKTVERFMEIQDDLEQEDEGSEINAEQAMFLGRELLAGGYTWNTDFDKKAVCIENGRVIFINEDVKITLLSPTMAALKKLKEEFEMVFTAKGIPLTSDQLIDDAYELFIQQSGRREDMDDEHLISGTGTITKENIRKWSKGENYDADSAAANGSSIAFQLEADGKKILMLADAHAETIMAEIKAVYGEDAGYPIIFEAIKVAHHGSFRNNCPDLFKLIDSPKYLFSTNGKHQSHVHPDIETIAMIINRPPTKQVPERELTFNHVLPHLKGLENEDLKTTFHYSVKMQTFITLP